MFYAVAIVILMIKYMKSERNEARLTFYYEEFVKREKFDRRKAKDTVLKGNSMCLTQKETAV